MKSEAANIGGLTRGHLRRPASKVLDMPKKGPMYSVGLSILTNINALDMKRFNIRY